MVLIPREMKRIRTELGRENPPSVLGELRLDETPTWAFSKQETVTSPFVLLTLDSSLDSEELEPPLRRGDSSVSSAVQRRS